jgi:hypothetical protein
MKDPGIGSAVVVFGLLALLLYFLYAWAEDSPSSPAAVAGVSYTPQVPQGVQFTVPGTANPAVSQEPSGSPADKDSGLDKVVSEALISPAGLLLGAAVLAAIGAILYRTRRGGAKAAPGAAAFPRRLGSLPASFWAPVNPPADPCSYTPTQVTGNDSGAVCRDPAQQPEDQDGKRSN